MSTSWQYQDEAFFNVTEGIRTVVMHLTAPPAVVSPAIPDEMQHEMITPHLFTRAVQQEANESPHPSLFVVEKLALLYTLTAHKGAVRSVALSADGQTQVSGSDDKTLKVWKA